MANSRQDQDEGSADSQSAAGFVVDEKLQVLEFLGRTAPYVEFSPGTATMQLRQVVHPLLQRAVLQTVEDCRKSQAPGHHRRVRFWRSGEASSVEVSAAATTHPKTGDPCIEVRLREVGKPRRRGNSSSLDGSSPKDPAPDDKQGRLEEELAALKREIQDAALSHEEERQSLVRRLDAAEAEREQTVDQLEQAYAELQANHEELQIAFSERESAELDARNQRDFVEAVLDAADALVLVTDRDGKILRFNRACQRATGLSLHEIEGHTFLGLVPAEQRADVAKDFATLISGRFPIRFESDWVRKDGSRLHVAWSSTALTNAAGEITHAIGVGIDITKRRQAQRALERSRHEIRELAARLLTAPEEERSRIARELHDDLVQDLAATSVELHVLARRPAAVQVGLSDDIRRVGARIQCLAESVRDLSHRLHPATLEQLGLISALRASATRVRTATAVAIRVESSNSIPRPPPDVELGLYRMVQEAVWNAAHHAKTDLITVTVSDEDGVLAAEVSDYGCGFDVHQVRQAGALGLLSMEERARLIGAKLTIDSQLGVGTTVRIETKGESST